MSKLITIDIPHKLGRSAARTKIESEIEQVAGIVPGASLRSHHWDGNTLLCMIEAMGQPISITMEVFDDSVHAIVDLPALAALFGGTIQNTVQSVGTKLLR